MYHILPFSFCLLTCLLLDPSPWLVLSFEMKKEDSLKPYGRVVGFLNYVIHLSFQMPRNLSGSLMAKVALTRPWLTLSMETRLTSRSAGSRRPSSLPKWCKSTHPRWRRLVQHPVDNVCHWWFLSLKMCPTWPTSTRPLSSGIWRQDMCPSWSTPTLVRNQHWVGKNTNRSWCTYL